MQVKSKSSTNTFIIIGDNAIIGTGSVVIRNVKKNNNISCQQQPCET